jgi:hypothetical protein
MVSDPRLGRRRGVRRRGHGQLEGVRADYPDLDDAAASQHPTAAHDRPGIVHAAELDRAERDRDARGAGPARTAWASGIVGDHCDVAAADHRAAPDHDRDPQHDPASAVDDEVSGTAEHRQPRTSDLPAALIWTR